MDVIVRDGMTQPVFDASKVLSEEVFVEIPADTDGDGRRDLIKLFIERPSELDGVSRVPVIMEISPYYGGTEDPPLHDPDHNLSDNVSTMHYSYDDVKSRKHIVLPPARIPKGKGKARATKERLTYKSSGWYSYFIPRGYAVVRVCCIGNMFSEGFCNYGGEEETLCATAAIDWLCGRAKAYQDMENDIEVEAYWCSGNVGMIGLSYNGTLAIAAAAAGVEGLKTIVPFGSISSAYDYYRANGAVAFPGGYLGEDADVCARMCIGRALDKSPVGMSADIRANCESHLSEMVRREDSITGDYNDFWDERSYMNKLHKMKASVLLVHGLDDWNVRTKQFTQLWEGLKKYDIERKLIVHRLRHEMIERISGLNFFEIINKWFDYWLRGVDNGIMDSLPDVKVMNNITLEWDDLRDWNIGSYERLYLCPPTGGGAGALRECAPDESEQVFADDFVCEKPVDCVAWEKLVVCGSSQGGRPQFDRDVKDRLVYLSDELCEDLRLSGTVKVTVRLSADRPRGNISAMVVDYGRDVRKLSRRNTGEKVIFGGNAGEAELFECYYEQGEENMSEYGIVTRGWTDAQNPNPSGKIYMEMDNFIPECYYQTIVPIAGESYSYTFDLQPMDYIFKSGHRIGVIIMSSDACHSIRPFESTEFTLYAGEGSFVELPVLR